MCHPSQTPGLPVSCTIASEMIARREQFAIPRGKAKRQGERTPQKEINRNDLQTPLTQITQNTDPTSAVPKGPALCWAVAWNCALQAKVSTRAKLSVPWNVNSCWKNRTKKEKCNTISYSKSAKSSSSGVSWSYKKYCLLRSSPCRPDDNNRLESSSKGSSCPAVAQTGREKGRQQTSSRAKQTERKDKSFSPSLRLESPHDNPIKMCKCDTAKSTRQTAAKKQPKGNRNCIDTRVHPRPLAWL